MSTQIAPQIDSVTVAGMPRTFSVVGSQAGAPGRALVVVFHGSRQSAAIHRAFTGAVLERLVEDTAVVAYLDGYRGNWNDARRESRFPVRRAGIDDVAFFRAVIERLTATHGIDPARVVVAGYSNGGQMVFRLLHELPGTIAAAAVVAATMPVPDSFLLSDPPPWRPVPISLVHGTADPVVPYRGGRMPAWARLAFRVGGTSLSSPETARYFAHLNGISDPPTTRALGPDPRDGRLSVDRTDYRQQGRPRVSLFTVHGGGHTVPGPQRAPAMVGPTASAPSITDITAELLADIR